jgi:hypothetical protein
MSRAAGPAVIRLDGVQILVFGLPSDLGIRSADTRAAGFILAAIRQTPGPPDLQALRASILIVKPARRP